MRTNKIIDTHVHFLNPGLLTYPWMKDNSILNKSYLPKEYRKAIEGIKVEKIVFVEVGCDPIQYLDELQWVTNLASEDSIIKGIVSWAPMEKGENIKEDLDKLYENKLVVGVRRNIEFESNIDFCIRPDFINAVKLLSKYNFSFDICISHIQLSNTIEFVRKCPDITFILDHIGKPDIRNKIIEPWKSEIKQLSMMPNVFCKISGLVNDAEHYKWTEDDLKPYICHIIECFGLDRLMYGGDWPVMLLASHDYCKWFNLLEKILSREFTERELQRFYYKNPERIYKLNK